MKVALIRERPHRHRGASTVHPITMALPFYRSQEGRLVHRIRSGRVHQYDEPHYWDGAEGHASFTFWCGNIGFIDTNRDRKRGELFDENNLPERAMHCAICEGKATGAGFNGARVICGRPVLFSPRT